MAVVRPRSSPFSNVSVKVWMKSDAPGCPSVRPDNQVLLQDNLTGACNS